MKKGIPVRPIIHDPIDLIPTSSDVVHAPENVIVDLAISQIVPYHDHLFRLYEGDRLNDMVESIRENGVLTPTIVHKIADRQYEMLAGHNRMNASRIAGKKTIPAIIKEGLTEEEAWLYVVETNLLQRGFTEMLLSERAAVIAAHYGRISNQGKRTDIERELLKLEGREVDAKNINKNSRKSLADEYGLSSSTIARLLRINKLIPPFKERLDNKKIQQTVCVEISYLSEVEQQWLDRFLQTYSIKPDLAGIHMLHQKSKASSLTEEGLRSLLLNLDREKSHKKTYKSMKIPKSVYHRYFESKAEDEICTIVTKALELYFQSEDGHGDK